MYQFSKKTVDLAESYLTPYSRQRINMSKSRLEYRYFRLITTYSVCISITTLNYTKSPDLVND